MFNKTDYKQQFDSVDKFRARYYKNYVKHKTQRFNNNNRLIDNSGIGSFQGKKTFKKSIALSFWQRYCENTSIHGIKYISMSDLHWSER